MVRRQLTHEIKHRVASALDTLALARGLHLRVVGSAASAAPRTVAWISMPRSGSTYLCDLIDHHPGIYSCLEVFHKDQVFTREPAALVAGLNRRFGTAFVDEKDPALIALAHKQSDDFLAELKRLAGDRVLSFKLFPGHLRRRQRHAMVLAEPQCAKVLFKRDLLSAFVSLSKAKAKKTFEFSDTTGLQVTLDPAEFQRYARSVSRWFTSAERFMRVAGQPYAVLHYEELMRLPDERSRLERVVEVLSNVGVRLPDLQASGVSEVKVSRKRQDKSDDIPSKVANWDEFSAQVRKLGIERYLP